MTPAEAAKELNVVMVADGRGPEGRTVDAGGLSYHVLEFGEGRPTVFLHGGGPGCTGWTDFGQVATLFARERRVILVDLLQYGRSDKPSITGPMWDFHTAHLVALFDALGLSYPDLVCNSWGGTMALCLAATHPDLVGSLVITGSMPVFRGPLGPLIDRSKRGRLARERYYGGEGPTREKMRDLMATLEWYDPDLIPEETIDVRYAQSLQADEIRCGQSPTDRGDWQDLTARLGDVAAPTLFMWGMFDGFLTPDYPLMCANLVQRGNLHVMERASHHLQEERPEAYFAVVNAFLDSAAPSRSGVGARR